MTSLWSMIFLCNWSWEHWIFVDDEIFKLFLTNSLAHVLLTIRYEQSTFTQGVFTSRMPWYCVNSDQFVQFSLSKLQPIVRESLLLIGCVPGSNFYLLAMPEFGNRAIVQHPTTVHFICFCWLSRPDPKTVLGVTAQPTAWPNQHPWLPQYRLQFTWRHPIGGSILHPNQET